MRLLHKISQETCFIAEAAEGGCILNVPERQQDNFPTIAAQASLTRSDSSWI